MHEDAEAVRLCGRLSRAVVFELRRRRGKIKRHEPNMFPGHLLSKVSKATNTVTDTNDGHLVD